MPNGSDGVLSHWHTLFEDFSISTQEFYAAVEEAIRERNLPEIEVSRVLSKEGGIASANREYLRIRRKRIAFDICSAPYGNGHFFSWWLAKIPARYGLLIVIAALIMLVPVWTIFATVFLSIFKGTCASVLFFPFTLVLGIPAILLLCGFAIEQGWIDGEEWILSIPWASYLYMTIFNPTTYYRLDTALMFRDSVRFAVNEVLNGLREEKGLRLLGDEELEPDAEEALG